MQIVEIKNNLVKVSYNTMGEDLVLSGFVVLKDLSQSFIGQIIHLEANSKGNFAVIRLLFNFDSTGVITSYNGSIPSLRSVLETVAAQELLELLPVQAPVIIGELAQQKTLLKVDLNLLEKNLLVCCEKNDDNSVLVTNFAKQLAFLGKKLLVINVDSEFDLPCDRIVAGENFKLPLNYDTINFIYEKGLTDAKPETKALIQEIFLEVQNYVKTLPEKYVPFESFRTVVDYQHEETGLVELVLLKNKLLKYYEEGVFAQDKDEFNALKVSLRGKDTTLLDLSNVSPEIQREMISYAYSLIEQSNKETYVIVNVQNSNSDKKLLKQIFKTGAFSTLICSYAYKYLTELKQLSKNMILFAPLQQQTDFAYYNMFLNKLNPHEFIAYGEATHHLPLIIRLDEISDALIKTTLVSAEEQAQGYEAQPSTALDEEIRRDVDRIYTTPKSEQTSDFVSIEEKVETEPLNQENVADESQVVPEFENSANQQEFEDLTEDDLDFIEDLNIVEDVPVSVPEIVENVQETQNYREIEIVEEPIQVQSYQESASPAESANWTQQEDILPAQMASTPIVPVYSADIEPKTQTPALQQGEVVTHPKYGRGTVEKLISYGSKTLCSINFDNVGRRLLDPTLSELTKV